MCTSIVFLAFACQRPPAHEDPAVWKKVRIDFKALDENGLAGNSGGKVAVNYEFCIPKEKKKWRQVQKIDPTAQRTTGKGRIRCSDAQWLIIGSTHQARYKRVLYELARLPYVERIEETHWE